MNCLLSRWVLLAVAATLTVCNSLSAKPWDNEGFVRFAGAKMESPASGNRSTIELIFEVKKGYHIQSDKPGELPVIPSALKLRPSADINTGPPEFPAGKAYRLEGTEEMLSVFDGLLSIRVPVIVLPPARGGSHLLKGELYYQACDDRRCFFPRTLDFKFGFEPRQQF